MKKLTNCFVYVFTLLMMWACAGDDDNNKKPDNEEEEITRVVLHVTRNNSMESFSYKLTETGAEVDTILLEENETYSVKIEFWNDDENPAENVTEEVLNESDEHLVCFSPNQAVNLQITRNDRDINDLKVGIHSSWQTGDISQGNIMITLKHQPDIKAMQSSENCNIGETDVEVTFPIIIQ